jgi:flagellar L-ring protein precursor FlgH
MRINVKRYNILILSLTTCALIACDLFANDETPEWSFARRLMSDRVARNVGDLLTVVISEVSSASMDAKQSTDKSIDIGGSASMSHATVDSRATPWTNATLPSITASGDRKFAGSGSMQNDGNLSGAVTVRVIDILPGGHLLIEGKRTLVVQNESLTFTVMGTVRQEDVASDNTVKSSQIGDLTIRYQSDGSVAKTAKKGLLSSFVDWVDPY